MNLLKENYEMMMEEVYSNKPLSNEKARMIVKKYDKDYRSKINNKNDTLFEEFINLNHPLLCYKY